MKKAINKRKKQGNYNDKPTVKLRIKNIFWHLHTINKHKWYVFKLCCRCGIPWRGIRHDLSKYSPTEFFESARYFHGDRSPNAYCKQDIGYAKAWLHHKGRNKHHHEYWYDYDAPLSTPMMPYKYIIEMICDDLAAGIVYNGKKWTNTTQYEYWMRVRKDRFVNKKLDCYLTGVYKAIGEQGIDKVVTKENLRHLYEYYVEGK